jgi:hypothetical protein
MRLAGTLIVLTTAAAQAQTALEIAEKAQQRTRSRTEHYEGTLQVIDAKKKVTEKRWTFDRIGSHGNSKTILRFTAPPEVKGVALLIVNHPERASDQWMYTVGGAACWKLESRPKQSKSSQYNWSQLWIRKDNYVVVRIDNARKDKLARRIEYSNVENIQNIWTPKRIEVTDLGRDSRTVLTIDNLRYDTPMKESDFTVEALRRN